MFEEDDSMPEHKLVPVSQLLDYLEHRYGSISKWQKKLDDLHVKLVCLWIGFKSLFVKKGE